ncbi:phage tail fiber protein [Azorhizobium caulinodans ORS 571]|uniref:Phage tail fiber protein n=1 Tax=Azorhizobium caulinodans (strain ATCC 43989 / DSM 5975 / JCM 20966 / LMG 6465 / NBRC 14845 / NCIMB 13405 / ORS 571) TaxID=438753 RepID=A8IF57_AZOC5|nr:phage tail fiber protein [Azorhizobium caulinodans]BAF89577.1 phage tail fiber protein [Azorhizobium caulinodans ORS 571]
MALSYAQYQGNGSQQTFAVPFPYLDRSHIQVRVALDLSGFTWDDPQTIRITPAPAPGAVVEIRRVTPRENRMVDFVDGSVLTESDLDLANIQTFYIVQEAIDIAGGTLELLSDGSYGAGGRRIKNVGTAIEPRDAITKEYHDGVFLPQMNSLLSQGVAARDVAVSARDLALAARDTANAARDTALQYRDEAGGHRSAAATHEANAWTHRQAAAGHEANAGSHSASAQSSASTAVGARDAAQTYRNAAETFRNDASRFRNEAETFRNQAAQSAANAALWNPSSYYTRSEADGRYLLLTGGTITDSLHIYNDAPTLGLRDRDGRTAWLHCNGGSFYVLSGPPNSVGADRGEFFVDLNTGAVWCRQLGDLNTRIEERAAAWAGGRVSKGGDTMTGDLMIEKFDAALRLHSPNISIWTALAASNGEYQLHNTSGVRMAVNPDGYVWAAPYGFLHDYINTVANDRGYAQANALDYVHRVRITGYGEAGFPGSPQWTHASPNVITGVRWSWNGFVDAIGYRSLQVYLPKHGGWHAIYDE